MMVTCSLDEKDDNVCFSDYIRISKKCAILEKLKKRSLTLENNLKYVAIQQA